MMILGIIAPQFAVLCMTSSIGKVYDFYICMTYISNCFYVLHKASQSCL